MVWGSPPCQSCSPHRGVAVWELEAFPQREIPQKLRAILGKFLAEPRFPHLSKKDSQQYWSPRVAVIMESETP